MRNPLYYNTNGFAFHRLEDACRLLAKQGWDGVAWTPDVHHLDPTRAAPAEVEAFGRLLRDLGLRAVVETGARFVLDPERKHRPSLLDAPPEALRRLDFLKRCVDAAAAVGAPVVSTWSGVGPPDLSEGEALHRLAAGLVRLCEHAAGSGVRVGFEPEPGMAVETAEGWTRVRDAVGHPVLGLTLDAGHCLATGEGDPAAVFARHAHEILVLQVDDHPRGRHEHRMFGEGDLDWPALARAVRASRWEGPVEAELSAHSSTAAATARESLAFLRGLLPRDGGS